MSYGKEDIIKRFLKQIEEKLPCWLKDDKKERNDVLDELEEHIWDKAAEIADGGEITAYAIQQAIDSMGSPNAIAREYKKRGTPKIWISEELWPWYLKVVKILLSVIIGLNVLGFVISVFKDPVGMAIVELISGIWNGFIWGAVIITVIFVVFSMEGFLPEDFAEYAEKEKCRHQSEIEFKTQIVVKKDEWKNKWDHSKPKPPLKRGELLSDGIFTIIWGSLLITMPIVSINEWLGPDMVGWMQIAGGFSMMGGFISLIQALVGVQMITAQRILLISKKLVDIMFLQQQLLLPELLTTIPWVIEMGWTFWWLKYLIYLAFVVGLIETISKVISLRSKYKKYEAEMEKLGN